jgi:hypothetical protein
MSHVTGLLFETTTSELYPEPEFWESLRRLITNSGFGSPVEVFFHNQHLPAGFFVFVFQPQMQRRCPKMISEKRLQPMLWKEVPIST